MLVDTGAQVSLIFLPLCNKQKLQPPRCNVSGIGPGVVKPVGSCFITFSLDSFNYKFLMEVVPRKHSSFDIILGDDFLRLFQGVIDYRTGTVQFGERVHRFGQVGDGQPHRAVETGPFPQFRLSLYQR